VHCRARELALTLNRPRALLSALSGLFLVHWARADLRRARQLAAELRELGDSTGDVPMQVLACGAIGLTCFDFGEFIKSRAYLEKGIALYDPAHRASYSELRSNDERVELRTHLSWLLACLGYLDQASLQREAALEEARRLSHPPTLALALVSTRVTGRFEPESLLQYADELTALATEHGLGLFRAMALIERGWCLAALGRANEGIALLTAGLVASDQLGRMAFRPWALTLLGDAHRMARQWQTALAHFAEARRLAEETEERWFLAETLRLRGDVLLAIGDPEAAKAGYREAIAIARQQSAKLWELRAAMGLARLWRDQNKRAEAHELLAPVYGWFTEGLGTPVLKEAEALLRAMSN
jgi:predicted ATPase